MKKLFMLFASAAITFSMMSCNSSKSDKEDDDEDSKDKKESVEKGDREDRDYEEESQADNSVDLFVSTIDNATSKVRMASSEAEVESILNSLGSFDGELDENYVLTSSDKRRCADATSNFFSVIIEKSIQMSGEEITPEISEVLEGQISQMNSMIEEAASSSNTLGDFGQKISTLFN